MLHLASTRSYDLEGHPPFRLRVDGSRSPYAEPVPFRELTEQPESTEQRTSLLDFGPGFERVKLKYPSPSQPGQGDRVEI